MKKCYLYSCLSLFFSSCVEEFDLELETLKPRVVIEGVIENGAGPHFVRLLKSKVGGQVFDKRQNNFDENIEGIENAVVVISDDTGQLEILEEIPNDKEEYQYSPENRYVKYIYDKSGMVIGEVYPDRFFEYHVGGYYKSKNFIGVPGRTYTLKVITEEETYIASDVMPTAPVINRVYSEKRISEKDGAEFYTPFLSYEEPEALGDRYLIQNDSYEIRRRSGVSGSFWNFEVLSDKYLKPGTNIFLMDNGSSAQDFGQYYYSYNSNIYVKMSSLSKPAYDFFNFILEQFDEDGGAYKPTPASPPSNISNNGLGFFYASSVVYAHTKIGELD